MLHMLAQTPPPPLSIFVVTKEKRSFIHFMSKPAVESVENMGYYYDLPVVAHARYDWEEMETPVVYPGGYHSIVIMRPTLSQPSSGISIQQLCTYRTDAYEFSGPEDTGHCTLMKQTSSSDDMQIDSEIRKTIHHPVDQAIKHPVLPKELALCMRRGTRCLQFDEWLGRLFIATANDPRSIHVLDWSL